MDPAYSTMLEMFAAYTQGKRMACRRKASETFETMLMISSGDRATTYMVMSG